MNRISIRQVLAGLLVVALSGLGISAVSTNPVTSQTLLSGQSATTAASREIGATFMNQCRETAVYVQWSAGTSAGVVTVESADQAGYSGTWAPLATVTWSAESSESLVQITGVMGAIRTRISTTITGGTVTTYLMCN